MKKLGLMLIISFLMTACSQGSNKVVELISLPLHTMQLSKVRTDIPEGYGSGRISEFTKIEYMEIPENKAIRGVANLSEFEFYEIDRLEIHTTDIPFELVRLSCANTCRVLAPTNLEKIDLIVYYEYLLADGAKGYSQIYFVDGVPAFTQYGSWEFNSELPELNDDEDYEDFKLKDDRFVFPSDLEIKTLSDKVVEDLSKEIKYMK